MRRRRWRIAWVIVAASLLFGAVGFADAPAPDQDRLIEQVLTLSGTKQQIERLAQQNREQIAGQLRQDQLPPEDVQRFHRALDDAFRPGAFYAAVKAVFKAQYDQQQMTALATWLQTPLAARLTTMELTAETPEAQPQMRAFAQQLQATPPPETRLALMRRLDAAAEVTESMLQMMRAIMQSTAGVFEQAGGSMAPAPGSVEHGLQAIEQQRPLFEQAALLRQLFIYRTASDEHLTMYIQFMESPTGKWFTHVSREALTAAFTQSTQQAMRQLIPLIQARRHAPAAQAAPTAAPAIVEPTAH